MMLTELCMAWSNPSQVYRDFKELLSPSTRTTLNTSLSALMLSQISVRLQVTADDLRSKDTSFQIGVPPLHMDIITILGCGVLEAWPDRVEVRRRANVCNFSSPLNLNKKTAARLQDLAGVEQLEPTADQS